MQNLKSFFEAANTAWNQAFNSKNIQALAALYTDEAILSPGNGQALSGRAAVAQLFQSFIDAGVHSHTLEIVEVGGNGDTIYQVARWGAKGAPVDGASPAFGGITTNVMIKDAAGNWRTCSHVWNTAS
jgi:uncharacterized protein (TIGR02246 family)